MPDLKMQTVLIDLEKTDLAPDARPHNTDALEILTHDMREQGQLQEIIVESKDGRYTVIAGVGRTLAAKKLGWGQIRASVREGVTDFDRARITFSENEDREDANPYYQAGLVAKMLKAKGCEQKELAKELGLSPALVSAYLAINDLPKEISAQFKRLNLGQLIQITRLSSAKAQVDAARECEQLDLSVRQLKALINRMLRQPATRTPRPLPPPNPDPLAQLWPPLKTETKFTAGVYWDVKYGKHELSKDKALEGWFFFVSPFQPTKPQPTLAAWFNQMTKALEGKKIESEAPKDEVSAEAKQSEAAQQAIFSELKPRLPKTPAEEAELADIAAKQGPKAAYAWIYGPDNTMVKAVPANTWEELGMTATDGLKQVLDGIKQFQNS